jgi:hypothetical protein
MKKTAEKQPDSQSVATALKKPKKSRVRREVDDEWRREQAMQAGMAFGCDGYNDEMGY